ncbi:MAG: DUF1707 domain-containing protein [Acidimicrobiales bacterium]
MADNAEHGRPPAGPADPSHIRAPQPVPDLVVDGGALPPDVPPGPTGDDGAGPGDPGPVSDDDRNRYGVLLDRAAERGLLTPHDYEVKLGDLASATSLDEMNQIVTELPVFEAQASPTAPRRSRSTTGVAAPAGAALRGSRTSPWLLLAIVVALAVVSLVFLAVYARHVGHSQGSAPVLPAPTRFVSGPRL